MLSLTNKKRSKWSMTFLIALMVYLVSSGLEMTLLGESSIYCKIGDGLKVISMLLLVAGAAVHIRYYSLQQWILFGLLAVMCGVCCYKAKIVAPVLLLAFWINMADVALEDILYVYLVTLSVVLIFAVVLSLMGILPDRIFSDGGHGFGFITPNAAPSLCVCILMAYICIRYGKIKWYEWILMIAFAAFVSWIMQSLFVIIVSAIGIIIGIILSYSKAEWINKIIGALAIVAYPVCWIAIYLAAKVYDANNAVHFELNHILNNRLELGASAVKTYGAKLLGQHIIWSGGDVIDPVTGEVLPYNIVDSSYLYILINYGWIYSIIIMALYVAFAIFIYRTKKWNWTILIITMIMCGLTLGTVTTITYNPVVVAIGTIFFVTCFSKKTEETR